MNERDIAVIAMNCRFPQVNSLEDFWTVLAEGKSPILDPHKEIGASVDKIHVNSVIQDIDKFDAEFFNYNVREAEILDPQIRLFLQLAWEVLETAGYNPFLYEGSIGIFAGASISTYLLNHLMHHPAAQNFGKLQTLIYNEKDYLTSLIAYHLNLKGPCVTVQTACSTGLVAMHLACESLLSYQCEMALVGGVTLSFPENLSYSVQEGGLLSKDGFIRAFDAAASGTVYSNGAGMVLLKPLQEALKAKDSIVAVIKGTAINNDGSNRNGFSSPGLQGQALVMAEAIAVGQIDPETITYVETHGSGTQLGDTIEFEAMRQVFSNANLKTASCAIGSVKTNIGHTQVASGIAGFIKACLCLMHKRIVPSLHYNSPNPQCDFANSPFYVNQTLKEWRPSCHILRAGVNSFGLGGINAHVVLEEAPIIKEDALGVEFPDLCLLSAKSERALKQICIDYLAWIKSHPDLHLNDFAYTTRVGRASFPYRSAIVFVSREDLIHKLEQLSQKPFFSAFVQKKPIYCQLGNEPIFNLRELHAIAAPFLDLKPLLGDITEPSDADLNLVLNYSVLLRLLKRLNVSVDGWNYEQMSRLVISSIDEVKPLPKIAADYFEKKINNEFLDQTSACQAKGDGLMIPLAKGKEAVDRDSLLARFYTWIQTIWLQGASVDWTRLKREGAKRIPLPTYPFEKQKYFIEPNVLPETLKGDDTFSLLARAWEDVMGLKIVNYSDNFFELGGHSLLATQLLYAVEKLFGYRLSLQDFLENPTIEGMAKFLADHQADREAHIPLPEVKSNPKSRYEPFPLTDIQQAYWVGRQSELELGNIATHMYFENDLIDLDMDRFQTALNKTIDRHEMLRAIILTNGTQVIIENVKPYEIACHDLRTEKGEGQKRHLSQIREQMSHEIIHADQWPLFRIVASKLTDHVTRLHISIDLLVLDAWSIELWLKEIGELYLDSKKSLPQPQITFRDYVLTVKDIESGPLYQKSKEYWQNRIRSGFCEAPQLPLAKLPSQLQFPRFARYHYCLAKDKWNILKQTAKRYSITPPVLLIGAFSFVLRAWTKKSDFTLNLTLFNRLPVHPEVQNILGDFTSLTLLEIKTPSGCSFVDHMRGIQQQLWNDLEHRYFSGPRVAKELLKEETAHNPIFPIVFTSLLNQEEPVPTPFKKNPEDQEPFSVSQTPQVWLDHQVMERDHGLYLNWDAVDELFPDKLVEIMFSAYIELLEGLARDTNQWDIKRSIPTKTESQDSIHEDSSRSHLLDCSLYSEILKRSKEVSNRIAIATRSRTLTYREIVDLSSPIAAYLSEEKLKEGELVAVLMPKGWEMVVVILGILRAGGAYLPIDISYPLDRIEEMLSVSQVAKLIKDDHLRVHPKTDLNFTIWDSSYLLSLSGKNPPVIHAGSESLAYAFFTSGSTGTPKCVEISHRSAWNTIQSVIDRYRLNQNDAVLALSSFSFDLSVFDIFGLLSVGGKIIIPHDDQAKDPKAWLELIQQHQATIWNSTPALMQMLVSYISDTDKARQLSSIRLVMLSGDVIPVRLGVQLKQDYQIPMVVALGGATEAAIWSIWHEIDGKDGDISSIPYGKPMPGQQLYVLNDNQEECLPWVEGEIYIGGLGLSTGYRNNPAETRYRFIDHNRLGRIYRTGDRGRYRADKIIEILGRLDNQIKVRGYRIELGEIESKLNQHEWVKSCAVIAKQSHDGSKELIAFVELESNMSKFANLNLNEYLITNPVERLLFKVADHGIRKERLRDEIQLSRTVSASLKDKFLRRKSSRHFLENKQIRLSQIEECLSHLRSIDIEGLPFGKRLYGSGGGLYPVQVYIYVKADSVADLENGIYYYQPKSHCLHLIEKDAEIPAGSFPPNNRKVIENAAFLVFLVAELQAIEPMYGREESEKLIYLEAGLITQILETHSVDSGIGLCQIGGAFYDSFRAQFHLKDSCRFIHCLAAGPIGENHSSVETIAKEMELYYSEDSEKKELPQVDPEQVLKEYLKGRLPEFMVPSRIQAMPSLPLTPNGKVDRLALNASLTKAEDKLKTPLPATSSFHSLATSDEQIFPELEMALTQIWKSVLKDRSFCPTDNFFDIGGNSITLVHIFREIQDKLNVKIEMIDLFKHSSIRRIANYIAKRSSEQALQEPLEDESRLHSRRKALLLRKERLQ